MKRLIAAVIPIVFAAVANGGEISLPFTQHAKLGVLRVEGKVNGRVTTLIFDTGATRTMVAADVLGIPRQKLPASVRRPAPGVRTAAIQRFVDFGLGSQTWCDIALLAADFAEFREVYGEEVGGIVGQDLLKGFDRVEIDYKARKIILTKG